MKKLISTVALLLLTLVILAQTTSYTGTVKDAETGEGLVGVRVQIKDSAIGTITDMNGYFKLSSSERNITLVFNYLGYKTVSLPVGEKTSFVVEMQTESHMLDELVVIGYGTQRKETLVGSVSTVKSEALVSVPASNLTQSLAGKATGLTIVQPSGEIGRDEAQIFIRGKATFESEAAQPLIVIDGIIRENFAHLDPNEVESINILKDASATAVFGVKGANGVIIVTTKRGTTGKAQVSFTSQFAVNSPMRLHTPIDGYRTAVLRNELDNNQGSPVSYSATQLMNWRTGASPYTEPDIDWMNEIMKPFSTQQQYNVNVRGGSNSIRYFISVGYFNQQSPFKNDDITRFSRYNFRSNLDIDVNKNLSFALNMGARIEDRIYPTSMLWSSWDIYRAAFSQSGIKYPINNPDGSYAPNNISARILDSGTSFDNRTVTEIGLNMNYKMDWLLKGLAIKAQVAYDDNSNLAKKYDTTPSVYEYTYATDIYVLKQVARPLKYDWDDVHNSRKIYWESALTYNRSFGKHNLNSLLLVNQLLRGTDADQLYATQGLVGRLVYNYNLRYLAEFNFGLNGSENFSPQNRYGIFPAFSLGWVMSEENFWQESALVNLMNNFKIRGSLGWVGNDRAWIGGVEQRFIFIQQYNYMSNGGYMFGDNKVEGVRADKVANPNVTWETARKFNIGFDVSFLNNLFTLSTDYFHEYRVNILREVESKTPAYVGATFAVANVGKTQNQGVEIDLSHFNQINRDFSYNIKGNFSFARSKVLERATPEGVLPYQRAEGFPIDTPIKYITEGYFQSFEEIENSPSQLGISGNTEVRPGDLKYKDINGDGIIDQYDRVRMGFPVVPEVQYGVTLGCSWKGFDLSCLLQGTTNVSFDKNWEIMWAFSNNDNVFPRHWYYWTPETGDNLAQYTQLYGKYFNNEAGADYTLSDGSYVRLKNVDIGYTFPKRCTEKVFINNMRVYVSALNLITWSKEKSLDPDNRDNRGGKMPPVQTLNFGLNVNF